MELVDEEVFKGGRGEGGAVYVKETGVDDIALAHAGYVCCAVWKAVEAAKLAPRQDPNLALVYEREKQKGNANRATLAVARKMVAYLLAVDRGQRDFVPFADSQSAAA